MAADEINIRFGATIDDLKDKLQQVVSLFSGVGSAAQKSLAGDASGAFGAFGKSADSGASQAIAAFEKIPARVVVAMASVGAALAGVGAAMGIYGLAKDAINAADHLNDLSQKTGIAADVLGGIGFAASQAGGTLDSAAAASGKLNRTLAEAAAGSDKALAPFVAMGIAVTDAAGKTKAADAVMIEVASHFETYKDGPEKAALAVKLFGKAGADIIPMLNDGGAALQENIEYYRRFAGVTADVASKSDAFNDTLGKLDLISGAFKRTLAAELLPSLQAVANEILNARENSDLFKTAAGALKTIFETLVIVGANVVYVFKGIGAEIGGIAAQVVALARGDFGGFKAIGDSMKAEAAKARGELDALERRILGLPAVSPAGAGRGSINPASIKPEKLDAPRMAKEEDGKAEAASKVDASRNALAKARNDAALALDVEYLKEAGAIYEGAYKDNLLTIQQFYDAKLAIEQRALVEAKATKQREMADAQASAGKAGKEEDRNKFLAVAAKLQGEINVLTAREGDAVRSNTAAREAAEDKLNDSLAAIQAQREKAAADDSIATDTKTLAQKKALRQIDAEQAFMEERALEQRSFAASMAALDVKRQAIRGTEGEALKQRLALNAEEQAAERAHQQKLSDIDRAAEIERQKYSIQAQKSVQAGFADSIKGLLNGTTTIVGALRSFANTIRETFTSLIAQKLTEKLFDATGVNKMLDRMVGFVTNAVGKMVQQWVVGKATEEAVTVGAEAVKTGAVTAGAATRTGVEAAAAATSKTTTIGDAIMTIGAKAWQAAASVYAAIAAIPIIGPFLAPAAALAAGAVVMGFASRIASSEGGEYQVDQDRLNFVHKNETILPAPFASGLRSMIGEGGVSPLMQTMQQIRDTIDTDTRAAQKPGPSSVGGMVMRWQDGDPTVAKFQAMQAGQPVGGRAWGLPANPMPGVMAQAMSGAAQAQAARAGSAGQGGMAGAAGSAGQGGRGGDTYITNNIQALDGVSVKRILMDNARHVAGAVREHGRNMGGGEA